MNWYNVFYWITRADSIKQFFNTSSNVFTWFAVLSFIIMVIISIGSAIQISESSSRNNEEDSINPDIRAWKLAKKYISTMFYISLVFSLVTWSGYVFTPTKKEALLIAAGGGAMKFLTTDSSAKKLPSELFTFVVSELKSAAKNAEVDLGISSIKDKMLDEAKTMTTDQLMEKMKTDTTFAKIVLNK